MQLLEIQYFLSYYIKYKNIAYIKSYNNKTMYCDLIKIQLIYFYNQEYKFYKDMVIKINKMN